MLHGGYFRERFRYAYNAASNRTWRENKLASDQSKALDEFYTYDGLPANRGVCPKPRPGLLWAQALQPVRRRRRRRRLPGEAGMDSLERLSLQVRLGLLW